MDLDNNNGKKNYAGNDNDFLVRQSSAAGSFYPDDSLELKALTSKLLNLNKSKTRQNIAAIIVPHAGYIFSGVVAASAFAAIPNDIEYDNIFLIGPSHIVAMKGASIDTKADYYETPLGKIKVNSELCDKILNSNSVYTYNANAHQGEHCLDVQLPFIQSHFKTIPQIVPIIIGTQSLEAIQKISSSLAPYFNKNNLFVISSDFSHYPTYDEACKADKRSGDSITENSVYSFIHAISENHNENIYNLSTSACGLSAIASLLFLTQNNPEITIEHLKYMNSGDTIYGDKERVVGYHSFLFLRNTNTFSLTENEKSTLLNIARETIKNRLNNRYDNTSIDKNYNITSNLKSKCGAFVTLTINGKLRGCIGHFGSDIPLYKTIIEMAESAAFKDPRFYPLQKDEFDKIRIEISVLTPLKRIFDIKDFKYGSQGIYIEKDGHSGTFLPQVAQETNWTKEEFLGHCSRDKAHLDWDGWKDADLYTYEAIIFNEEDVK